MIAIVRLDSASSSWVLAFRSVVSPLKAGPDEPVCRFAAAYGVLTVRFPVSVHGADERPLGWNRRAGPESVSFSLS